MYSRPGRGSPSEQPNPANQANPENQSSEDSVISYNLGGIRMNQAAFRKLEQEISLVPLAVKLPPAMASDKGEYRLSSGAVPVDRDIFRKIVVRESRVPQSQCGRLLRPGLDRPHLLRNLHRPRHLRRSGEEESRESLTKFERGLARHPQKIV